MCTGIRRCEDKGFLLGRSGGLHLDNVLFSVRRVVFQGSRCISRGETKYKKDLS